MGGLDAAHRTIIPGRPRGSGVTPAARGAGGTTNPTYLPVPVKKWGGQPLDMVPLCEQREATFGHRLL
jgi:hypothetical protein